MSRDERAKKQAANLRLVSTERVGQRHWLLRLTSEERLPRMKPGQFVEVLAANSPSTFLRRPISINFFDEAANELWLLVAAVGDGTRSLTALEPGQEVNCVMPLGHGFSMEKGKRRLLVGGGVGVAPLLYMGAKMEEMGDEPTFLLGARSKGDLLEVELFRRWGRVLLTTEDGSVGVKGFVTDHPIIREESFDLIATCGPLPMMKAVARVARERNIECEASLENLMACGLGACLCCVEKTVDGNLCVCTEGPVFNTRRLLWT